MLIDAAQNMLPSRPRAANRVRLHVIDHVTVDMLGRLAQGQFPQGCQIAGLEKKCFSARSAWALI